MKTLENVKNSGGGKEQQRELGLGAGLRVLVQDAKSPGFFPHPEPEDRRSKRGEKDRLREDEKTKTIPGTFVLPDLDQFI